MQGVGVAHAAEDIEGVQFPSHGDRGIHGVYGALNGAIALDDRNTPLGPVL